jgi:hypothetical protein
VVMRKAWNDDEVGQGERESKTYAAWGVEEESEAWELPL